METLHKPWAGHNVKVRGEAATANIEDCRASKEQLEGNCGWELSDRIFDVNEITSKHFVMQAYSKHIRSLPRQYPGYSDMLNTVFFCNMMWNYTGFKLKSLLIY